jgi:hypothetical protein
MIRTRGNNVQLRAGVELMDQETRNLTPTQSGSLALFAVIPGHFVDCDAG